MRHVIEKISPDSTKPLSEPVLYILLSLANCPKHGYALMKDIAAISGGRVRLTTGTLYGALRRLISERCIAFYDQEDTSREKQAYMLTEAGRKKLTGEVQRLTALAELAAIQLKSVEG